MSTPSPLPPSGGLMSHAGAGLSLGGTAMASGMIRRLEHQETRDSGNRLKKGAITWTGTQIQRSKLGKGPMAARPDRVNDRGQRPKNARTRPTPRTPTCEHPPRPTTNATNAGHASSVDGVLIFPTARARPDPSLASSSKITWAPAGRLQLYAQLTSSPGGGNGGRRVHEGPEGVNADIGTEGREAWESLTSDTPETNANLNEDKAASLVLHQKRSTKTAGSDFRGRQHRHAIHRNIGLRWRRTAIGHGRRAFLGGGPCCGPPPPPPRARAIRHLQGGRFG